MPTWPESTKRIDRSSEVLPPRIRCRSSSRSRSWRAIWRGSGSAGWLHAGECGGPAGAGLGVVAAFVNLWRYSEEAGPEVTAEEAVCPADPGAVGLIGGVLAAGAFLVGWRRGVSLTICAARRYFQLSRFREIDRPAGRASGKWKVRGAASSPARHGCPRSGFSGRSPLEGIRSDRGLRGALGRRPRDYRRKSSSERRRRVGKRWSTIRSCTGRSTGS